MSKAKGEMGNAVIEFIAFGVVLFVPLATFATNANLRWVAKEQVVAVASQLARAYAVDRGGYDELLSAFRGAYQGLEAVATETACCVEVRVARNGIAAQAKQVL